MAPPVVRAAFPARESLWLVQRHQKRSSRRWGARLKLLPRGGGEAADQDRGGFSNDEVRVGSIMPGPEIDGAPAFEFDPVGFACPMQDAQRDGQSGLTRIHQFRHR